VSIVKIGSRPPPSFDDPVGVLDACHRRIEDRLALLERALAALPAPEAVAALGDVVRHFDTAAVRHTEDEEFSVFPRLAGTAALDTLIGDLEAEHRVAEAVYLAFRTVAERIKSEPALLPDVEADLRAHAAALTAAYREHIRREEAGLFPPARALPPAELRAIGIEMRLRRGGGEP
jgi:hemerythrin-like domain-containing protein